MSKVSRWTRIKWAMWRLQLRKKIRSFFSLIRFYLMPLFELTGPLLWLIYHFSGARWAWEHLNPPTENEIKRQKAKGLRAATAFPLWLVGSYIALFGIASSRYESHVDRYEIRANALVALLANDNLRPIACSQISEIQKTMVPLKPDVFRPDKTIKSFRFYTKHQDGIELLVEAIESCKSNLAKANLSSADLSSANLSYADLIKADLIKTDLTHTNLLSANLSFASLSFSRLEGALLFKANLTFAILNSANFSNAILNFANLSNARLSSADLSKANISNANLNKADLAYADLSDADLTNALLSNADLSFTTLSNTNLSKANLSHAKLSFISDWRHENWDETNIFGIKDPPEGFREWALNNGAVEEEPEEWSSRLAKRSPFGLPSPNSNKTEKR